MKRRLTESDFNRIVRRVLNEDSTETIKIKAWLKKEDRDKALPRDYNIETTNHNVKNEYIEFDWKIVYQETPKSNVVTTFTPTGVSGRGSIRCGSFDGVIGTKPYGGGVKLYITEAARKKLTKWCDAFVSNDSKMTDDYA